MKRMIMGLAAALYLAFAPAAKAEEPAKASVEVMAGQESATLDVKVLKPLDHGFTLFNRARLTANYEEVDSIEDVDVSAFNHFKVIYNIPHLPGLSALVGVDLIPGVRLDPRVGLQYSGKFGDLKLYQDAHVGLDDPENPDVTMLTNITYQPMLLDELALVINVENVTNVSGEGHGFSTQRLRLGVDIDGYQFGAATDLVEPGKTVKLGDVGYNIGGFLKKDF